jgi:predicted MFS family arabinose efflux permease
VASCARRHLGGSLATESLPAPHATPQPATFGASPGYSRYVLALLFGAALFNLLDRNVFGMLIEPIKREFDVSDGAIGLLTGFSFALFYTAAGIPVARWADRGVRRSIIALGLALWSALTLACGLAQTFPQLVAARLGVGIGEAAGTPTSHSLISDYFPPERRATALAVMSMGASVGVVVSFLAGGWISELYGWRAVFIAYGVPGVLLALLIRLTLREPPRGRFDPPGLAPPGGMPLRAALRFLLALPSYRHLVAGFALHSLAYNAGVFWYPSFLARVHGLSSGEIGTALALLNAASAALGVVGFGRLADALGTRDVRWYMRIPALTTLASAPLVLGFLFAPTPVAAFACLVPSSLLLGGAVGGTHATTQALAPPALRALASALNLLVLSLAGAGLGPALIGGLSDQLEPAFGAQALRYSLIVGAAAALWSGLHNLRAAVCLPHDLDGIRTRSTRA